VALDGLVAVLHERPDQCGRRVEHPHLCMQHIADEVSLLVYRVTHLYTDSWWLHAFHAARSTAYPVALDDLPHPVNRGEGGCAAEEHLQGKPDPKSPQTPAHVQCVTAFSCIGIEAWEV
jgi:hypothetical protein